MNNQIRYYFSIIIDEYNRTSSIISNEEFHFIEWFPIVIGGHIIILHNKNIKNANNLNIKFITLTVMLNFYFVYNILSIEL